ncbi:phosphoribosyltransferase-like protein [Pedobacter zeae]|uniref:Hypoxanthine-guanine phosphoribosyltransferase n=1 Tax=Pedobacter zeae TaxID=1737356 RepID=A0A7W6P4E8_9SPHI|nr:hypothetical protein [Pedobacter zeae]MBB4107479.1 hypoxanthine-guanine phosphoribosyltransferase [Pedobacter zeae]GGG99076.1 hypothetical protein GCM10007422_11680 [Pedobacter zeae]
MEAISSIRQLTKIFKTKEWFSKDSEDIVYDNFCNLLEVLEPSERELLLELTDRYLWISGRDYEENIKEVINQISPSELDGLEKLYLFPIIKPSDEGKAKSGITLVYDVKSMMPKLSKYRHMSPIALDNFESFQQMSKTKGKSILFLIDDFIGSGDTLYQCLEEIEKQIALDNNRLVIATISCQKATYEAIQRKGIKIYSKYLVEKGITDFNDHPFIEEKKALMREIESQIPGARSFSLGWQESEAVITLKRTPDNTFPIFWKKLRKQGKFIGAPFYRE